MSLSHTLALVMIVKNEEVSLGRSLASVSGVIDELVVVDTGSTDLTKEIADAFARGEIEAGRLTRGAKIIDFEWCDDFSAARNAGLQEASAEWILTLDADEELAQSGQKSLAGLLADSGSDGAFVRIVAAAAESHLDQAMSSAPAVRLFRNRPDIRYVSPIHEQVLTDAPIERMAVSDLIIVHFGPSLDNAEAHKARRERNIKLMRRAISEASHPAYLLGKLGEDLMREGMLEEARAEFQRSIELAPDDSTWVAQVERNLALCLVRQGKISEAEQRLGAAISRYTDYTDLIFLQGEIALQAGQRRRAVDLFKECLAKGDPPAYYPTVGGTGGWRARQMLGEALNARRAQHV